MVRISITNLSSVEILFPSVWWNFNGKCDFQWTPVAAFSVQWPWHFKKLSVPIRILTKDFLCNVRNQENWEYWFTHKKRRQLESKVIPVNSSSYWTPKPLNSNVLMISSALYAMKILLTFVLLTIYSRFSWGTPIQDVPCIIMLKCCQANISSSYCTQTVQLPIYASLKLNLA